MPKLKHVAFGAAASLLTASLAYAGDHTAGKAAGELGAHRMVGAAFNGRAAKRPSVGAFDPAGLHYSAPTVEKAKSVFTLVGRTRDGKIVRKVPSEELIRAITGGSKPADEQGAVDVQPDPAAGPEGGARVVVGKDNRVRVNKTDEYPYSAIGYLQVQDANDADVYYMCTAVLVGPKTIVTGAHCLYKHDFEAARGTGKPGGKPGGDQAGGNGQDEAGGGDEAGAGDEAGGGDDGGGGGEAVEEGHWDEKFEFWPALNGENDAPFGSFEYDTAYVFEGYLTEFDGTYGSVLPYDIGVITLSKAIGDDLGYLGYWGIGDKDLRKLEVNLVGYDGEKKPALSMWRSTCKVDKVAMFETTFIHTCDVGDYTVPLYVYDKKEDSRYLIGMNVAVSDNQNVAIRLYGPIYDWINTLSGE